MTDRRPHVCSTLLLWSDGAEEAEEEEQGCALHPTMAMRADIIEALEQDRLLAAARRAARRTTRSRQAPSLTPDTSRASTPYGEANDE